MLKLITHMQISRRLLLAFLLAAVVPGIIISILGFSFINTQRARSQAIEINIRSFKTATETGAHIPHLFQLLDLTYEEYIALKTRPALSVEETMSDLRDSSIKFEQAIRHYQQNYQITTAPQMHDTNTILLDDDPKASLAHHQQAQFHQLLHDIWPDYREAQEHILQSIERKQPASQIGQLLQDIGTKQQALQASWDMITDIAEQTANAIAFVGPSQTDPILLATLIAFLSTILVVTAIGYIIYLTIVRPLHQLALLTRQIGRGDMEARSTLKGRDEISLVASSMNNMLDSIVHLLQETQMQRDILQGHIEKLVSEVSGISEGDLRVRAEISTDALGMLADSFNFMIEELSSLVIRVKIVASEVERTTTKVQESMTKLVETGRSQLSEMAEATHEVEILTSSNRQVAELSQELHEGARKTRRDAQFAREAVYLAFNGINRINNNVESTASKVLNLGERSREIGEIVEAISGIAHQTNRLALDAAIQAAMAGDNGKGFGAVAADIRRLAERAKAQAAMIAQIVRGVRDDIDIAAQSMQDTTRETATGSHLTREASETLEAIFTAVEHQAHEIEQIYQAANRQQQASSAIALIVQHVSDTTRENSTSTQEASRIMERLAQLVKQLRISVEAFKLREDQQHFYNTGSRPANDDTPLTVSGIFRTVRSFSHPMRISKPLPRSHQDPQTPMPQVTGTLISLQQSGQSLSGNDWPRGMIEPQPDSRPTSRAPMEATHTTDPST